MLHRSQSVAGGSDPYSQEAECGGKGVHREITTYVSNELVDVCSDESLKQYLFFPGIPRRIRKLKNKFSDKDLKEIILLMMQQRSSRFGWEFLDSISKSGVLGICVTRRLDR